MPGNCRYVEESAVFSELSKRLEKVMQKILLIEDQLDSQIIVKSVLDERYRLLIASNAEQGLKMAGEYEVDLVLLDVNLPDENGFNLISKLKNLPNLEDVPIFFLTVKGEVTERVTGFSLGADDYIVKPFEPLEFRARIESKLNARLKKQDREKLIKKGRFEINLEQLRAYVFSATDRPTDLELTPYGFRLLVHFVKHENQVFSREQLMDAIWGKEMNIMERTIDRHISALRKKLDPRFEVIESVHGLGYRFSFLQNSGDLSGV